RKTPHIHVRRPAGLVRRPRRSGGAPNVKSLKSRATAKATSLVGRVLTRLPLRQSPVGRVLTRRSFADIKIQSFRAVTARATFLCLCKETWRKETHPACAPGALHRVRGAGGIFRAGILPARKTLHIHVRRPCGVIRRLRRYGGPPEIKINSNGNGNGNGVASACHGASV